MGVKKSNFVADTALPAGAEFDFWVNGQNFKISANDLFNSIDRVQNIKDVLPPYTVEVTDDAIRVTTAGDITLPLTGSAYKRVSITAQTGIVNVLTQGSDGITQSVITIGNSVDYIPFDGEWTAI